MRSYCSPVPGRQRLQCAGIVIHTQQRRCCCRRRCRCHRQRQCCQFPAPVGSTEAAAAAEQRESANARDNSFLSFSFKLLYCCCCCCCWGDWKQLLGTVNASGGNAMSGSGSGQIRLITLSFYFRHSYTHTRSTWKNKNKVEQFSLLTQLDNDNVDLTFAISKRAAVFRSLHKITLSLLFAAWTGDLRSASTLVELFTWTERSDEAHDAKSSLCLLLLLPELCAHMGERDNEESARRRERVHTAVVSDWTCRRCQAERMSTQNERGRAGE